MAITNLTLPATLKAFLAELIDYAGLFPPAQLPLREAITHYTYYCQEPDHWLLGRFIIPTTRLAELAAMAAEVFPAGDILSFSVLGRGGNTAGEFLANLQADVTAVTEFRRQCGAKVSVDVFEGRLPAQVLRPGNEAAISDLLALAAGLLEAQGGIRPFYEAPLALDDPEWPEKVTAAIRAIAAHNQHTARQPRSYATGFKLRCGGVAAAAFPTPDQVAFAILACRHAGVPLKATAGLHHPVRRFDESVHTKMHGFLNVFGAGILAQVHPLGHKETVAIIEDEDPGHFTFTADHFTWQPWSATPDEISAARRDRLISFGSCSFAEPRQDLQVLGLLP